jgi:hypothetical protein
MEEEAYGALCSLSKDGARRFLAVLLLGLGLDLVLVAHTHTSSPVDSL